MSFESQQQAIELLALPGRPPSDKKLAVFLRNVFTVAECEALIKRAETIGFEPAKAGDQSGRSNDRCIIDDQNVAAEIFRRVRHVLPEQRRDDFGDAHELDTLSCINERLRVQRYGPDQAFAKHVDGQYEREDGSERSHITVQLYLSQQFEGGTTRFLDHNIRSPLFLDVVPETGACLIFEHELVHAGSPVTVGLKYTLRTEAMYKKPAQ